MTFADIAGVDEAGRGSLAGPVVASAVQLSINTPEEVLVLLKDSKQLSKKQRDIAYFSVLQYCDYGVADISAKEIDELGIKKATEKAMNKAVSQLKTKPKQLLVDGRDKFQFDIPSTDIIRGDEKELCISAASIIAKVTRDQIMIEYSHKYRTFGFEDNKGYGAKSHMEMLEHGEYSAIHRKTYDPLKTFLTQGKLF